MLTLEDMGLLQPQTPVRDSELPNLNNESRPITKSQKYNLRSTTLHKDIAEVNVNTCLDNSIDMSAKIPLQTPTLLLKNVTQTTLQ